MVSLSLSTPRIENVDELLNVAHRKHYPKNTTIIYAGDFFGSRALAGAHNNETLTSFFERIGSFPDDLEAMREMVTGGLSPSEISFGSGATSTVRS